MRKFHKTFKGNKILNNNKQNLREKHKFEKTRDYKKINCRYILAFLNAHTVRTIGELLKYKGMK